MKLCSERQLWVALEKWVDSDRALVYATAPHKTQRFKSTPLLVLLAQTARRRQINASKDVVVLIEGDDS